MGGSEEEEGLGSADVVVEAGDRGLHRESAEREEAADQTVEVSRRPGSGVAVWPAGSLTVEVVSCTGLLVADMGGKSDPYVTVMMGKSTLRTRCVKKMLDPVFNEKLQPFAVDAGSAEGAGQGQSLSVEVWDKDSGPGQDDFLGHVDVSLRELCGQGLLKGGQVEKHYALGDAQGRLGRSEKQQAKQRKAKGKHQLEPLGAVDLKFQFASS